MKVAVVILAVAIVGAFAQTTTPAGPPPFTCTDNAFVCTFKKLGHTIKYHAKKLGGKLADVGKSVLDAALSQGGQLLANAGQATLGTVLEHLNKEGLVGKRDTLFDKVKDHLSNGYAKLKQMKENLHAAFKKAVTKLYGKMVDQGTLKKIDEDADKQVDEVVDDFKKENKKGFFGMAKTIADKLKDIWAAGMAKLKAKYGKKDEARALLDAWNAVKGHFSNLVGGLADTFKPHLDALKSGVAALGDKVKEHAGNLVNAAKGHFDALKTKLSGHIDTLKGHAKTLGGHAVNAVNALKEAVTSIATQALANTKDTVSDALKTGSDAAGVAVDHLGKALGGN